MRAADLRRVAVIGAAASALVVAPAGATPEKAKDERAPGRAAQGEGRPAPSVVTAPFAAPAPGRGKGRAKRAPAPGAPPPAEAPLSKGQVKKAARASRAPAQAPPPVPALPPPAAAGAPAVTPAVPPSSARRRLVRPGERRTSLPRVYGPVGATFTASRRAGVPFDAVGAARGSAAPATTRRATPSLRAERAAVTPNREPQRSRVTETVTRIVEIVPAWLRGAVVALAGLGVLLGLAFAFATLRARGLDRQRARLVSDVGVLQSAVLPTLPHPIHGVTVTAAYRPAQGLAAGGDFYDAFALPDGRVCLLLGDVAGHGRDAVPVTALVRYTARAYLEAGLAPRMAIQATEHVLDAQLADRLVTLVAAIYEPGSGRLTYACAGHPQPLLSGGTDPALATAASPPLGAGVPTGRRQTSVPLAPGSAAVFFSDGLTDVRSGPGRLGREALMDLLGGLPAAADATTVVRTVLTQARQQTDDVVACVLQAPHDAGVATNRTEELEVGAAELDTPRAARFLAECGVEAARATYVLGQARARVALTGTATLCVSSQSDRVAVSVGSPEPALSMPFAHARGPERARFERGRPHALA